MASIEPIRRLLAAYDAAVTGLGPWPPARYDEGLRARLVEASGLFDREVYLDLNPDVREANFDAIIHHLRHGDAQRRPTGSRFDAPAYLDANPDIVEAGENSLIHFILSGAEEDRPLFPGWSREPSL